jgi:hypothetical protein
MMRHRIEQGVARRLDRLHFFISGTEVEVPILTSRDLAGAPDHVLTGFERAHASKQRQWLRH